MVFLFGDRTSITDDIVEAYARSAGIAGYYQAVLAGLRGINHWAHGGRLHSLAAPTAVVWGAKDRLLPIALGRELVRDLPNASFHELADCGHSPPEEAPEKLAQIARDLFERSPVARAS
jgi:pimeloyl-ACP methyl ester carboxylesterase